MAFQHRNSFDSECDSAIEEPGGTQLSFYLTKAFMDLSENTVRTDFANFLKVVAIQKSATEAELWKQIFGTTQKPGMVVLVKTPVATALTELNNFQADQYTVRPPDMKFAFPEKHLLDMSMCTMLETISEKIDTLESNAQAPTDESLCIETVVQSAIAPLLEKQRPTLVASRRRTQSVTLATAVAPAKAKTSTHPATVTKPRSFSTVVAGKKARKSRSGTVTGSTGSYVGPMIDKMFKIQVGDSYGIENVKQAVKSATKVEESSILVESLAKSARDYSMAYRVKVTAMRADLASNLLKTDLWPAGMAVSPWAGAWTPLKKHSTVKIFVGNLSLTSNPSEIAQKVREIYEASGVEIEGASAEKFEGKKETKTCQNLVITLQSKSPGICMEPIQTAKRDGKIPIRLFVRRYRETAVATPPSW